MMMIIIMIHNVILFVWDVAYGLHTINWHHYDNYLINLCVYVCNSCKTVYTGHIRVDYSLDHGANWVNLEFYEAWRYSQAAFFHIELEIPDVAKSKNIRFRFTQNVFEAARDHWALDNVKVSYEVIH
jgi:hypothetical protein